LQLIPALDKTIPPIRGGPVAKSQTVRSPPQRRQPAGHTWSIKFYAEVEKMGGKRWDTSSLLARLQR